MPIPEEMGACIRHFVEKGKSKKQAIAICLDVQRRREGDTAREVARRHLSEPKEKKGE